ncbi:MAG: nucleoside triphosphate pyrophosphohydrolase [bacterium]|nr:nucleoside triphosphate pyrophosphohydrolase [bacterium]
MNDSVAPQSSELQRFRKIVARLRDPETGCPWDLKQNHDSLKKYFLEEVYEFLEEVDHSNPEGMEEELGDVLLQIYLHAQLLEESSLGRINLETVARKISDKIIRRHPHVFEPDFDQKDYCPQTSWRDIKAKEKSSKSSSSLFEKYRALPSLQKVEKIYQEVKSAGFRFESPEDSLSKVDEELREFRHSVLEESSERQREEFADIFMALYSAAVEHGYSPEELTQLSLNKFRKRWECLEAKVESKKLDLKTASYKQKKVLWDEAKREC